MMSRIASLSAGLMIVAVVGCSDAISRVTLPDAPNGAMTGTRDTAAFFQTDSLQYTLRALVNGWQTQIGVTFTNRSGSDVSFENCQGSTALLLQKWNGTTWTAAWSPVLPACLSPAIKVANGGSYPSSIFVFGGYPEANVAPKFSTTDLEGTYRLVWVAAVTSSGQQLPEQWRLSNRFRLAAESRH